MRIILLILISVIVVSLQLSVLPRFSILGVAPNLILATSIAWAIYQKDEKFSWLILIPAILQDLLIGRPLGLITLSIWLSFSLVRWLGKFLFKQSGFIPILFLSLIGASSSMLFFVSLIKLVELFDLNGAKISWADFFYLFGPAAILYNSFLCLLVFWIIKKIFPVFNKLK